MKFRAIGALAIAAVAAVAMSGALSGCQGDSPGAQMLVSYATMKVIEQGTSPAAQHARAEKIHDIASQAKVVLGGETATLGLLEHAIRQSIGTLDLSPPDAFLADALVRQVLYELQKRVGSGVLAEEQRFKVSEVLGWVIDATAYAGA